MVVLLIGLRWIEFRFAIVTNQFEIYAAIIAVFFLVFGVWIAYKFVSPKVETVIVEKKVHIQTTEFIFNEEEMTARSISKRELEVLELMSEGLSNKEIAERLFVSLNTIKTHSAKLFEKLEVNRRTQAIEKAKKLQLLPPTLG